MTTIHTPLVSHLQISLMGPLMQQNDKLTIKNLPLSVSNDEIKNMLVSKGINLVSPVKYGFIRKDDGARSADVQSLQDKFELMQAMESGKRARNQLTVQSSVTVQRSAHRQSRQ